MKLRLSNPLVRRPSIVRAPLPGFDPIYYLYWYPDIRAAGLDPMQHYLLIGWKEGRDPSAGFSTAGYLAANPDVARLGHNPLLHFVNVGLAEGRKGFEKASDAPAPRPDAEARSMKLLPAPAGPTQLQGYLDEATHVFIRGWALNAESHTGPADICIFVNERVVGHLRADEFRSDLKEEGIGNAHHGFQYVFDPALSDDQAFEVVAHRVADAHIIGRTVVHAVR